MRPERFAVRFYSQASTFNACMSELGSNFSNPEDAWDESLRSLGLSYEVNKNMRERDFYLWVR